MKKYLITFRSVTPAQRAQHFLRANGVQATLQRTPRWMEDRGCGYSLRLRYVDGERAVAMLQRAHLPLSKAYQEEDGQFTEVTL